MRPDRPTPLVEAVTLGYHRLATLWVLVPALAAMAAFVVLFDVAGRMVTEGGGNGLDLQKAFTPARFATVVAGWGDGVEAFKTNLMLLDFAFPLVYAAGVGSLVALATGGPRPGRWHLWLFALPWVAAALDWAENLLHLWLLADVHTTAQAAAASYAAGPVLLASIAAMLKFALLLAAAAGAALGAARTRRWWAAAVAALLFATFTPVIWA